MNWHVFTAALTEEELEKVAVVVRNRLDELALVKVKGCGLNNEELATARHAGWPAATNLVQSASLAIVRIAPFSKTHNRGRIEQRLAESKFRRSRERPQGFFHDHRRIQSSRSNDQVRNGTERHVLWPLGWPAGEL